jgi:hypothetical protein
MSEQVVPSTVKLELCPFCGGEAHFVTNPKNPGQLRIVHWPAAGVTCPARYDQVCDTQEQGAAWWNKRAGAVCTSSTTQTTPEATGG